MSAQIPSGGIQVVLDPGTWMWLQASIWVAVMLTIGIIVAVVWHLVSEFRTPLESKGIRKSSHEHKPGILLVGDEGYAEWKTPERVGNAGYEVTKPEGKWKFSYTGLLPRRGKVPTDITVASDKDLEKTQLLAQKINELNTRKVLLKGAKIPVLVGVKSKSILMSIFAIAGIELTEEVAKQYPNTFPIDIVKLKEMVVKTSYNQSQIEGIKSDSEHIGEERATKGGMLNKLVLFAGIAFGALGLVALALAMFLK